MAADHGVRQTELKSHAEVTQPAVDVQTERSQGAFFFPKVMFRTQRAQKPDCTRSWPDAMLMAKIIGRKRIAYIESTVAALS